MGAVAAARYTVTDPELGGVVLVSCPSRWKLPRNVRGVLAAGMTRTRPGRLLVARLSGVRLAPKWTNAVPPVALVAQLAIPVALVHGREDRFIACGGTRPTLHRPRLPRRLTMVPRMRHTFGPDSDRARARPRSTGRSPSPSPLPAEATRHACNWWVAVRAQGRYIVQPCGCRYLRSRRPNRAVASKTTCRGGCSTNGG